MGLAVKRSEEKQRAEEEGGRNVAAPKNVRVPFAVALFTAVASLAGGAWYLHRTIGLPGERTVPAPFRGTITQYEAEGFRLAEGETLRGTPKATAHLDRVFYVASLPAGTSQLKMWDRGVGTAVIATEKEIEPDSLAVASDGIRALFLAQESAEEPSTLFIWKEGLGIAPLAVKAFKGSWSLAASPDGAAILVSPRSKESTFLQSVNGEPYRAGDFLQLRLSLPEQPLRERAREPFPRVEVTSLGRSYPGALQVESPSLAHITTDDGKSIAVVKKAHLAPHDADGDGTSDLLVFGRGDDGQPIWKARTLRAEAASSQIAGKPRGMFAWRVGDANGVPVPGDYNGDGILDLATFTPRRADTWHDNAQNWRIFLSAAPSPAANRAAISPENYLALNWGHAHAVPVPADYDGDGSTDLAVAFMGGKITWHLLLSSGGFNVAKGAKQLSGFGRKETWGRAGDVPMPGDYDGDGTSDIAVIHPLGDGSWEWQLKFSPQLSGERRKPRNIKFGRTGDIPVPGQFNCDPHTKLAVYRPSEGKWLVRFSGTDIREIPWSVPNASPVTGDFDGDGCTDVAFFGNDQWSIRNSSRIKWVSSPEKSGSATAPLFNTPHEVTQLTWPPGSNARLVSLR